MADQAYLAVDIGASSGRHLAGRFDGGKFTLEEVYRFENSSVMAAGRLQWDLLRQWTAIVEGLRAAAAKGLNVASIGVDTWGVDFGLLGRNDELLGNPYSHRDLRTNGMLERAFDQVPRAEIFAATGVQFMQINSLYQLLAMRLSHSPLLDVAKHFLMMPDLFHWLLTGEKANEFTDATTSQMFDPAKRQWATSLLDRLSLPTDIFAPVAMPGTTLGPLLPAVAAETGLKGAKIVLPGTHDTASAVLAVPFTGKPSAKPTWCYISSGTWSLMGVEVPEPVINAKCLELNFTNEGGIGGTIRVLKNIMGLWLVQECRRTWKQAGKTFSWDELVAMSDTAPKLASLVDPDATEFLAPTDMPAAIRDYCRRTNQPIPENEGAVIRTIMESLALRYRQVLGWLEELTGGQIDVIHIVGGGTQNKQLCQATASACNRRVLAGPVEATALGNVAMQAIAAGEIADVAQAREVVAASFPLDEYQPRNTAAWDEAFGRFVRLSK